MSRIRFCSACFAAIALALSWQEILAQGLLPIAPQPVDSLLSPNPLGPPQKFGGSAVGGEPGFSRLQQAPAARAPQPHAAVQARAQRPPSTASRLRPPASRSFARGTASSVLALAPRYGEPPSVTPFCFPSSTLHVQQDARCNVGVPAYRGRFEELLGR
jgi:hypothetical protein